MLKSHITNTICCGNCAFIAPINFNAILNCLAEIKFNCLIFFNFNFDNTGFNIVNPLCVESNILRNRIIIEVPRSIKHRRIIPILNNITCYKLILRLLNEIVINNELIFHRFTAATHVKGDFICLRIGFCSQGDITT